MSDASDSNLNTSNYYTIAFYNVENLFDTVNDPNTYDDAFLPDAERRWSDRRLKKKVRKLGYAISKLGFETSKRLPSIIGLAEVENKDVIKMLLASKFLKAHEYDIVHYDSRDERGIDTALIYNTKDFTVTHSEVFHVDLRNEFNEPDYTRDILLVEGLLNGEKIHVFVNHWSSRREGAVLTEPKRMSAAQVLSKAINSIIEKDKNAKIMVMGDFNDDPQSNSVRHVVNANDLFNPMETLMSFTRGSLNHQLHWNLFDQILFTTNFFEYQANKHSFSKANIFDEVFLKQFKGKYKGSPFRTYVGTKYKGGYSDHFPVYLILKKG